METIRRLQEDDETAFRKFQKILLAEKEAGNDLVETKEVTNFVSFLEKSRQNEVAPEDPNWAASTSFYYIEDGEILGRIGCRWALKGDLARVGGHIGYVTRTDARGRGIMTTLLNFALKEYARRGVHKVLITARLDNLPSRRLIESFGGVKDGVVEDRGYFWQRYWVDVEDNHD